MEKQDNYQKTVLDNGVTIVTQSDSSFYSATIGIWVKNGSRDEVPEKNGISHFIEHMMFKGTKKRSAHDIAKEIDSIGGDLNAFTTRETSCYYVKVLKDHIDFAIDLLSDIFLNSVIDAEDVEKERQVILQEIRMVEDTPDDYIHDLFSSTFWGDSSLGRPVLGRVENVSSFVKEDLISFIKDQYCSNRIIISVAGNVNHDHIVEKFRPSFSKLSKGSPEIARDIPTSTSNITVVNKALEQVHFCLGTEGVSDSDPRRYNAYILNAILGDGMSSRLFQEIREKNGLAYNIYSYLSSYDDCGFWGVYVGTGAENVDDVLQRISFELKKVKLNEISADELSSAKEQLKGNMILGLESSDSRMQRLAHNEICFGRHLSVEETINEIERVKSVDVLNLANELLTGKSLNIALIGSINEDTISEKINEMKKLLNK
ncbi:MAG: insulinase family protein [Proteobacteria bacterium]|nr:insulinase family protein [Pseudomonadota bacterium]